MMANDMRNLFETETTISLYSERQRVSLCASLLAYRYVLYSFHQKFYEITFTYDTLHLLLTHHTVNTPTFIYILLRARASISITILTPYRLAVKYLFFPSPSSLLLATTWIDLFLL